MTVQATPANQPTVEQSEVQQALLCVTAGKTAPQWMDTQVPAHNSEQPASCALAVSIPCRIFLEFTLNVSQDNYTYTLLML